MVIITFGKVVVVLVVVVAGGIVVVLDIFKVVEVVTSSEITIISFSSIVLQLTIKTIKIINIFIFLFNY